MAKSRRTAGTSWMGTVVDLDYINERVLLKPALFGRESLARVYITPQTNTRASLLPGRAHYASS
jgi:hypothetical protein